MLIYSRMHRRVAAMLTVNLVRPGRGALLVGIRGNQAGIDRKSGPLDQPFCHAAPDHGLNSFRSRSQSRKRPCLTVDELTHFVG